MTVVALPQILTERLTNEGARAFVEILDKTTEESERHTLQIAEERFEKRVAQVETKVEQVRSDLIKWMFIFWIGQVTTITSILFVFFKR